MGNVHKENAWTINNGDHCSNAACSRTKDLLLSARIFISVSEHPKQAKIGACMLSAQTFTIVHGPDAHLMYEHWVLGPWTPATRFPCSATQQRPFKIPSQITCYLRAVPDAFISILEKLLQLWFGDFASVLETAPHFFRWHWFAKQCILIGAMWIWDNWITC